MCGECVLPDIGSLAMQRMFGSGMTINCCNVSCNREEEMGGGRAERERLLSKICTVKDILQIYRINLSVLSGGQTMYIM